MSRAQTGQATWVTPQMWNSRQTSRRQSLWSSMPRAPPRSTPSRSPSKLMMARAAVDLNPTRLCAHSRSSIKVR
ncbi:hypothetical protein DUNSADRAFT_11274 [Dunaliella salina]|uniref:Encoded protein n=1 Tax=Dunaliella salina TaxID=3046 RepID=A0ABQ7FT95_DUNSA|nr:hypothetical protein DUNSADRAFT_11274 [Dunaliella salina]|eukprot:KAF5825353.1 hypothetical protein DUNSADRAFT_11274 [Dunaliella salina]